MIPILTDEERVIIFPSSGDVVEGLLHLQACVLLGRMRLLLMIIYPGEGVGHGVR